MKLGYSTWGMPTVPAEVFIPFLARTGYTGVEITVIPGYATELSRLDRAHRHAIATLLREHRLELPALAAQTSMVERDPAVAAEHWRRLTAAVDLAVEWAVDGVPPVIDTTVGGAPADYPALEGLLFERMGALVAYAAERGVVIAAEPHVGSMLDTPERVLTLLRTIDSPWLKLNFDISHFNVMGFTIAETVPALAPHSAHTHVKDERGTVPDYEFLIPGEGVFDYVAYLQAMQVAGYTGFITPEVSVMVQRRPNYDPLAAAAQSYTTLAAAFARAGIVAEPSARR
jgi:inosose dehydratase